MCGIDTLYAMIGLVLKHPVRGSSGSDTTIPMFLQGGLKSDSAENLRSDMREEKDD